MYDIELVLDQMELELIMNMKKYLSKGSKTDDIYKWQEQRLKDLEKFRQQNKKIIKKYQKAIREGTIYDLRSEYKKQCQKELKRINKKYPGRFNLDIDTKQFKSLSDKRLMMLLNEVLDTQTKALNAAFRTVEDIYRQTIFRAAAYLNAGEANLVPAIDMAQQDFLSRGITNITYASGAIVPIRSYCEMALRTNRTRTALNARGLVREELGLYLVRVSYHQSSCEKCGKYENRIAFDDVHEQGGINDTKYPNLSEFVEGGLFHPNCRHMTYLFDPDVDDENDVPEHLHYSDEDKKRYEAEQHQRKLERDIRKYKRLKEGSLDPKSQEKYDNKLKNKEEELKQFLKENKKLRRKEWRERLE